MKKFNFLVIFFTIVTVGIISGCINSNDQSVSEITLKSSSSSNITSPDNISHNNESNKSNEVTLLYFWSEYCPWCKKQDPIVEEFMKKHPSLKLIIIDVNKPESKELMKKFQAFGTPTFILFGQENETALRAPGFLTKENFEKFVCSKLKDEECKKVKK